MRVSNFTKDELQDFYNKGLTMFFNYKRVFELNYSNNCGFFFSEITSKRIYEGKPYTLRGKFHAFGPDMRITKSLLGEI